MFSGIHEISVMLLGQLPLGFEILYGLSDLLILIVLFVSVFFIILLPFKLMRGW